MTYSWPSPTDSLELKAGETHVWKADCRSDTPLNERLLSEDERLRMQRYRFAEDRQRFARARVLLRRILAEYLDRAPGEIRFAYSAYGKPQLPDQENKKQIQFNVSHAGDIILLAFTRDTPIGVDVERIKPLPDLRAIARRFFSSGEQQDLFSLNGIELTEAFYRCWTRKEAVIKACGEGLSMPLDSFRVSLLPEEPARLLKSPDENSWILHNINAETGYAAAVAAPVVSSPVQYYAAEMF